jgi:hypothetical protein
MASVVPEYAWSARRRFWIMSHKVQLSLTASHCPLLSWTRPGTPLSHRPAAADARHSPRPYMRRILSHPGNPIRTAIFHTPAKIPTRARDQYGRTGPRGPATVPPLSAEGPDSREEGSGARTSRATGAPHHMTSHPASALPASKAHDRDRPVGYPGSTGHRPPVDPRRHRAQASPNDHVGASDSV